MEEILKWIVVFKIISFSGVLAETYTVKVGTESHVNVVDPKFLSFTVDPKYLFLKDGTFDSKECSCMASALSPSYIRIAGPSTEHMTLRNSTITLQQGFKPAEPEAIGLSITHEQWKKFASWSNSSGFELVFALNNLEKTASGLWDPNSALSILSTAQDKDVRGIYWQLGYECKNQSIEEYLTDLQTLRVIVDTFSPRGWKVVGGDVTPCLQEQSKSDFKDYVILSNEMLDAILLDGNSSSYELDRLSELERTRLLTTLAESSKPLWIADQTLGSASELLRAANWIHSLGHSARNGFTVHFRELVKDELIQPTLSFYMALLFKNLVGEKVLTVVFDTPSERASLFAHCTSLRHKPVPGAVTLFGANLDEEAARFSLKLGGKEEGGDIMQFVLGLDSNGNIIVNGRAMFYEGDIKPVVRRVRPYKTLLINLPPKSFGFWVLANTNTKACQETESNTDNLLEDAKVSENNGIFEEARFKRSTEVEHKTGSHVNEKDTREALFKRIEAINKDLKNIHKLSRHERVTENDYYDLKRERRQAKEEKKSFLDKLNLKSRQAIVQPKAKDNKHAVKEIKLAAKTTPKPKTESKLSLASRLAQINERLNATRQLRKEKAKKLLARNKVSKRSSIKLPESKLKVKLPELPPIQLPKLKPLIKSVEEVSKELLPNKTEEVKHERRKRSLLSRKKKFDKDIKELLPENEIDLEDGKYLKFGKILHKINEQLNDITEDEKLSSGQDSLEQQLTVKTSISGDDATIKLSEKSTNGIFKSAVSKVLSLLEEMTDKLDTLLNTVDVIH